MPFSPEQGFRIALGVFFTAIAVFYSLRLILNKTGKEMTFVGKPGTPQFIGQITFRFFRLLIWAVCLCRIWYHSIDHYLGIYPALNIVPVNLLGLIMMTGAFFWIIHCHNHLRMCWRLGIDPSGPQSLITDGMYARSRNPIFLAVLIGQCGFFLSLPSVFTTVCLLIGATVILRQVRIEEQHLAAHFPDQWKEYQENVPRWL